MTEIQQDPERISNGALIWSLLVVLLAIVLSGLSTLLLSRGEARTRKPGRERAGTHAGGIDASLYGQPGLAEQDARAAQVRLETYGWVDRAQGKVHIPLAAAIELYLREQGDER